MKQVQIAIIINVRGHHAEAFTQAFQDAGFFADVGEMPASVVPVQVAWHGVEHSWNAVVDLRFGAAFHFPAVRIGAAAALQARVIDELRHEQIQFPVIVVVEPHRAGGPSWRVDAALYSDIGECAMAVVVVQNAFPIPGEQHILVAVAVIVGNRHAHSEKVHFQTGLSADVGESAVTIVAVKRRI